MLDDHTDGAALPAASVRLKGWAVGKPGCFLTDLRVNLDGRIFPAFYGQPRPDLARYFNAREPFLPAGFEIDVVLVAGENRVEFEACEISGRWIPVGKITLTSTAGVAAPAPTVDVVQPHEFARALRLVLQSAVKVPPATAAANVVSRLPRPHVIRYPAIPFHGHLHHPPLLQRMEFGRVIVEGWLFHESAKIRRVAATVDLQAWQFLRQEGSLPYVAGLFPQFPQAAASRIHGPIDVPSQLPQPLSVRVYAGLEDGSWHLCHAERTYLYDDEQAKAPYVPFSPALFARSAWALRKACIANGFSVPVNHWFLRALREVWQEYRTRAPRRPSPAVKTPAGVAAVGTKPPAKVTLITHNLNFEGAPLFLLEYAEHLSRNRVKLAVVSAIDGPLRKRFEAVGASVITVDIAPLLKSADSGALRENIRALAGMIDLTGADLVVANTLSAYWGIHLAHAAGRPSLFYIHESTTPENFYFGYMSPATLPVVKETFAIASHVSFLTDATRRYYRPDLIRANHSINPGWIDLGQVHRYRAGNPRDELRKRLGLSPETKLIVNVGTVCNRKGQHIFVRAVDLLCRRAPELVSQCEFWMIGGRDSAYDDAINDLLVQFKWDNLRVVREASEPYAYYAAADLFVCSSYEESFPRVVLEAMAFELPIASTDVHGIPEMTRHDREALLVPAGDSAALADAMFKLLSNTPLAKSLALEARHRVAEKYDAASLLPQHFSLASAVAARTAMPEL
ncbi:MAG TPA: glycosyltransferase family 4 protein [Lacunisphaera sp.]